MLDATAQILYKLPGRGGVRFQRGKPPALRISVRIRRRSQPSREKVHSANRVMIEMPEPPAGEREAP
jgi:hypothetical protein